MTVIPHHRRLVVPPAESGGVLSFNASPDHDAEDPITGVPLVTSYELWVYDSTDTLLDTENIGKPEPELGVITVSTSVLLASLASGMYFVRVVALGPHADVSPDQVALSYPVEYVA